MEKNGFAADICTDAVALARMLEGMPMPLKSLELDHTALVARLESLMPDIKAFTACTWELWAREKTEAVQQSIEVYSHKFAGELNISVEDGWIFCFCLVMGTVMTKAMKPILMTLLKEKFKDAGIEGFKWQDKV